MKRWLVSSPMCGWGWREYMTVEKSYRRCILRGPKWSERGLQTPFAWEHYLSSPPVLSISFLFFFSRVVSKRCFFIPFLTLGSHKIYGESKDVSPSMHLAEENLFLKLLARHFSLNDSGGVFLCIWRPPWYPKVVFWVIWH